MSVDEAVRTIAEFCSSRESCEGCYFDREEICFFALCDLPCDWDVMKDES